MAHDLNPEEQELVKKIQRHFEGAERNLRKLMDIQEAAGRGEAKNDVYSVLAGTMVAHAHGTDRLLHMCDNPDTTGPIILAGHR